MKKWNKRLLMFIFIALFFFLFIGLLSLRNRRLKLEMIEDSIIENKLLAELDNEEFEAEEVTPDIRTINILAAGDIMYHMPQVRAAYDETNQRYNFDNNFKHIGKYLEASDIALANYETVAAGAESGYSGFPAFNSPVASLESIANAGFNMVNLNNNHSLDRGLDGLAATIENANKMGLKNIGNGRDYSLEEIDGIKLAFLSYSYGYNGNEAPYSQEEIESSLNLIDRDRIKSDIEKMKSKNADFIILYLHWGDEYKTKPNEEQVNLAKDIFQWGGDIILGSHPHVIQPAREVKLDGEDKFVIYSMGNFISNQREELMGTPYTEDGLMLAIDLEKDMTTEEKKILNIDYIPTWTYKYYNDKYFYEILPIEDALNGGLETHRLSDIEDRLKASYARTEEILFGES